MLRVKWNDEEMVALVAIYMQNKGATGQDVDTQLKELSQALNRRADALSIEHDTKFRNLNGLHKQYENLRYLETDGKKGLSSASALMTDVLEMYQKDRETFDQIQKIFWKKFC